MILIFFASLNVSGQFISPASPKLSKLDFDYEPHPFIQQFINYYQGSGGRSVMEGYLIRSGRHSEMMRRIFRTEKLPESLIVISNFSIWFNSKGIWLINKEVAKKHGLRRTIFIDETRSFERATVIVARHLKFLSEKYDGNWETAIAAYFLGETTIDGAIKRAKAKNFWSIFHYLPKQSRNFVPNVLASAMIAKDTRLYGFENIQPEPPFAYDLVRIPPSISLDLIAQFSESNPRNIKRLNPELISTVTPPENYIVRLPAEKAYIFIERLQRYLRDKKVQQTNKSLNRRLIPEHKK